MKVTRTLTNTIVSPIASNEKRNVSYSLMNTPTTKKYKCKLCGKPFKTGISLNQHREALHGKPLPKDMKK